MTTTAAERIIQALRDQGKPLDPDAVAALERKPRPSKGAVGQARVVNCELSSEDIVALTELFTSDLTAAALHQGSAGVPGKTVAVQVRDVLHVLALAGALPLK